MLRSTNTSLSQSQLSSSVYNYKTLSDVVVRPNSAKSSSYRFPSSSSTAAAAANQEQSNRKLIPAFSSRSFSSNLTKVSLNQLIVDGQWKFRATYDDRLEFKCRGIENLVYTCYDIMSKTRDFIELKTSSINELIRIWREASQSIAEKRRSSLTLNHLQISPELAMKHLIHSRENSLLQIALHVSLISSQSRMDLQDFGAKFGLKRNQFDVGSIKDSTKAFEDFIQLLKEQKFQGEREQHRVDVKKLPYKARKKRGLNANVTGTKFSVVRQAADVFGFSICSESDFTSNLLWNDTLISMDIVSSLKPYQKVNHFPTMSEISRKDLLAKNFEKLSRHLPSEYDFTPRTWLLPNEYNIWHSYASNKPKKEVSAYILKPNNGAMGHGIQVFCDYERIQAIDNYVIQEYIQDPFLIDGFKFDLRIYALLTSCDPLRLFIFNNGLVRMTTEKYETPTRKNASHLFMHLTNYSVNKYNVEYQMSSSTGDSEKTGSKRSLKFLFEYLRTQNLDGNKLWKDIQNIVIKTVFLAQPHLFSAYRMCRPGASPSSESVCFEILGFDILVDRNLKPWLIEVNRCPSFGTNEQIDFDIKMKLLLDTFELLRFRTSDRKKSFAIEKAEAQRRLYSNLSKPSRLIDDTTLHLPHGSYRELRSRQKKLVDLKEKLYLLQRETARETFENRHLGGFIRLFPVEDSIRMDELMKILSKSFDILSTNKKDLSWSTKYYNRFKEEEFLDQLAELEELEQSERDKNPRLAFISNENLIVDRNSPSASFASETSDEDEKEKEKQVDSLPLTNQSTTQIFRLNNSLMKKFATQNRTNLFRSTSINSKQRQTPAISHRPAVPLIPSSPLHSRVQQGKDLPISSPKQQQQQNVDLRLSQHSRLTTTTEKSSSVSSTRISSSSRRTTNLSTVTTPGRTSSLKDFSANDSELNRFYQLILERMHQLSIRYPNKSDEETRRIQCDINENWTKYRSSLAEFWLNRLDLRKRQAILKIVRNNVQQIMKQLWNSQQSIEHLSLNRHFNKLEQRLLANNGQLLWDLCQNKQNSCESSMGKSSNRFTPIELACCNRFIELSKQSLFIVYRYSIDEKIKRQHQQQQQQQNIDESTVMVVS